MEKYKMLGVSKYAKKHLCEEDLELMESFIGCQVEDSGDISCIDGKQMIIMPDGELTHIDFLELELISNLTLF